MAFQPRVVGPSPTGDSEDGWVGNPMGPQPYYSETRLEDSTSKGRREGTSVHLLYYKSSKINESLEKSRRLAYWSKQDPGFANRLVNLINKHAFSPGFAGFPGGDAVTHGQDDYLSEMEKAGYR